MGRHPYSCDLMSNKRAFHTNMLSYVSPNISFSQALVKYLLLAHQEKHLVRVCSRTSLNLILTAPTPVSSLKCRGEKFLLPQCLLLMDAAQSNFCRGWTSMTQGDGCCFSLSASARSFCNLKIL